MPADIAFSIMMITYNHEGYIRQAIESILEQDFPHPIEIVIGVDKSSDNTLEVCRQVKAEHPGIPIILLEHATNAGMYQNFFDALARCTGKYIAILEGDDFWKDKNKLLTQYQYFEQHPDCILSGGFADTVNEKNELVRKAPVPSIGKGLKVYRPDLLLANRFQTLTVALRKDRIDWEKMKTLNKSPHLDWPFFASLSYGPSDYGFRFNKVFGCYREHGGGMYSMVAMDKRMVNTAKTVFWLNNLNGFSKEEKDYLSHLFANLLPREKAETLEAPYSQYFKEGEIVYEGGKVSPAFRKMLSKSAWNYLTGGRKDLFAFKSKVELVRQTKKSKTNYMQLALNPVVLMAGLKMQLRKIFF